MDGHLLSTLQIAVKDSGVRKVKHRFRDTFITNKLRDKIDARTVQRWAGHEDVNVTMEYAAWLDGQSKAARDAANHEDERCLVAKAGSNANHLKGSAQRTPGAVSAVCPYYWDKLDSGEISSTRLRSTVLAHGLSFVGKQAV